MSEQLKAIFLDLDDTIVALEPVVELAWRERCRSFAPRVDGLDGDKLYAVLREVRAWLMSDTEWNRQNRMNLEWGRRQIVSLTFDRLGIKAPELVAQFVEDYSKQREVSAFVLPGAIETLNRFLSQGIHLALLTNGTASVQRQKIERFGLSPLFEHILIEEEFGVGKPDERVFRHILKKLGVAADEVWMVGDDLERDIGGAKNVGIFGVWVDWRGAGLPASAPVRPDKIISTISELL